LKTGKNFRVNHMFISKILLDVKIPAVFHDLSSINFLHDTFSSLAGGGKFVYRIDSVPLEKSGFIQPVVLVSENKPDASLTGKPAAYFRSIECYEYNIPVRQGMNYKFLLKANPSARIFFFHSDIEQPELQKKWLESESAANGFELLDCKVTPDGYITCKEKKVKLLSAVFEGSMKITDEKKFRDMLNYGIGRGREYGLGLVSVESYGCKNRNMAEEMKAHAENLQ